MWAALAPAGRAALAEQATLLVATALALAGLGGAVGLWAWRTWPGAAARLAEETGVVATAHPDHRLHPRGGVELRALAEAVNRLADRRDALAADVDARIAEANHRVAEERNRLAALMAQLPESVLVANTDGRILLYNTAARRLLGPAGEEGGYVGLGRSVYGVVDRDAVEYALAVAEGQDGAAADVAATVVTTAWGDRLVRARLVPVRDDRDVTKGFVLTLTDVTRQADAASRRDTLLRRLTEDVRSSLGSIRAAAETLTSYPDIDEERRAHFLRIVREEALRLTERVDALPDQVVQAAPMPLDDVRAGDLAAGIAAALREDGLDVTTEVPDAEAWLHVDGYAVVRSARALCAAVGKEGAISGASVSVGLPEAGFARLDLTWVGARPAIDTFRAWQEQPGDPRNLRALAERHGGESWYRTGGDGGRVSLLLPVAGTGREPPEEPPEEPLEGGRPEFYDFDLFAHSGPVGALEERPLSALTYTAFDTETTGLHPAAGDEIVAIGAVRIVNGRLLRGEVFDELVDPGRPVSPASRAVHGITSEMLAGRPTIDRILPRFARFCEETVLVGHNVAFDLRFFELKEARTGVVFAQPVLDTLLLSAALHPNHDDHRLEVIAERLGVPVERRHSALGDALLAGAVFLRLVALLEERGVTTLGDARDLAQRTFRARRDY